MSTYEKHSEATTCHNWKFLNQNIGKEYKIEYIQNCIPFTRKNRQLASAIDFINLFLNSFCYVCIHELISVLVNFLCDTYYIKSRLEERNENDII